MTLNQKILDVVIILGLVLTLIAIPLSLISNTLPSNNRLFVFAQQKVTDNTITTTPSTATVEGQRQEGSTSTMTATSDNNNNTLPLLPFWNEGDPKEK